MKVRKRNIAILGSTGSIGTQALDVIARYPERFEAYALIANNSVELLIEQARRFQPEIVVTANEAKYEQLKKALSDLPIKVWCGSDGVEAAVQAAEVDMVLVATVGFAGLTPTIQAITAGKAIALANKETLVVAGELITELALKHKTPLLPVDSEHSAIFQCLNGEGDNEIEKIWLTASGGPFRTCSKEQLQHVTKAQALEHPNWSMGQKVTIDSSTLINKGFEVIEAKWLFGVDPSRIEVLVHPQSIVHSMVQFRDTSVMAQLGQPDMRVPIQYAFAYPERLPLPIEPVDFSKLSCLTFEQPDTERFPNLGYAYEAIRVGGNMPCVLNAANEVAVELFLLECIGFTRMSQLIEKTLQKASFIPKPSLNDYLESDKEARRIAYAYAR
ncbi:MAG TPA: 1-deoxy-D-xylulose-5-phosphate reductoisomerase [Bacteroidales bacterium]|jgi:1-deoxy-D-xylulose-5-phosphate reductoisomerase|nr:1-deoxy-D-xylulose-5-phosphate reductoisomerase [Bacteroidales bacterium]